jgi:coenzyme F420 biosynthesis associated uncharacterized protein
MVDWSIARSVARLAAGGNEHGPAPFDVVALTAEMEPHVSAYTGLELLSPVPPAEALSRADWAAANLDGLTHILDPVAERLEDRLAFAGPLAAEAGLVLGYISQRVLGQYEVSLLGADAPPRLLFVGPNLAKAVTSMDVDPEAFGRWVCAHELTHVFQFQGVPWLRDHMRGLLRQYLATVDVRIRRGDAGGLPSLPDLGRLVETFREGGLAALVQTREQRGLLGRVQSVMAVIEGYSEHVMDVVAERAIPAHEPLRAAMDARRRNRSAPERVIERLLGFEAKLRQYEQGKRFSDAVVAEAGIEALNRVWRAPEALPSAEELERPAAWIERTKRAAIEAA